MKGISTAVSARQDAWACLAASAVAVLSLAACGGGSDDDSAPPALTSAVMKCSDIKAGQAFGDGTIVSATDVAATSSAPEYCEVVGKLAPLITFAVRLPAQWNNRTLYAGGGGFNGSVAAADAARLTKGFATIASTGGNDTPGSDVFALNPVALNDYAYLSVHRTSMVAREIIHAFYGKTEARNYFQGCSNGGREALMSAQRWADDFDGIISRAPALDFQNIFLGFNRTYKNKNLVAQGGAIPASKIPALNAAVLAACDAQDGLADGIVSKPQSCKFDVSSMLCTGAETDSCLTPAQLTTAQGLYSPYVIGGKNTFLGFYPGSESNWNGTETGTVTASSPTFPVVYGVGWVRYFMTQDPAFDAARFDPVAYASRIAQQGVLIDSTNPDLSGFRARQGKLILWHGLADPAANPKSTIAYYQDVVAHAGSQADADKFVKLYTAPGVAHCRGGTGADTVDLLTPLQNWVENGVDPATTSIVATKVAASASAASLSRPLCTYPKYAKYNGTGDVTQSGSFTCTDPD